MAVKILACLSFVKTNHLDDVKTARQLAKEAQVNLSDSEISYLGFILRSAKSAPCFISYIEARIKNFDSETAVLFHTTDN